ncbi:MAG: histidine phosphatase family protein [Gammaproteobacteria bacterium]|nr:histidine phosphatase family protein [Gammaproteobacteria bacterium]
MKALYLIRHGQTDWNVENRMQGHLDSPLTEIGRGQAGLHGKTLKACAGISQLIASPSGRTRETAYILNSYLKASLHFDESLLERDCGEWSGRTLTEIATEYPRSWKARMEDGYHHRPPGGENHQDMLQRVQALLDALIESEVDEIGLVTHGVMSRVILSYFLNLTPMETNRVRHPNDLFYRLEFGSQQVQANHFVKGNGPISGLLHRTDSGTIPPAGEHRKGSGE